MIITDLSEVVLKHDPSYRPCRSCVTILDKFSCTIEFRVEQVSLHKLSNVEE